MKNFTTIGELRLLLRGLPKNMVVFGFDDGSLRCLAFHVDQTHWNRVALANTVLGG